MMRTIKNLSRFLLLIAVFSTGRAASAQPSIPQQRIPSGIPAEVRQHLEGLYSADPKQRAVAAMQLLGKPEEVAPAIPFLVAMLHDDAVLHDEAQLMRLSLISSYARVFSCPNTPGEQAAETLGRIGLKAIRPVTDALMVSLDHKNWTVRANAIRALGEMLPRIPRDERESLGAGRALQPLIVALKGKHAKAREYAATVLRQIEDPRAVEPLISALQKDRSAEVREAAAAALGAIKDPRPVGPLIAALENPFEHVEVRVEAAKALGKIGDLRAVEPLIATLKHNDWRLRRAALTVAEMIRDLHVLRPLLVDALQDQQWRVRATAAGAATALGKLDDPAAPNLLLIALHDEQPNVRACAIRSLAELKDPRAVAPLIAALGQDKNSYVRWHAAEALGKLEDPRAIDPLTAALKDRDELVRNTARRALEKISKAVQARRT